MILGGGPALPSFGPVEELASCRNSLRNSTEQYSRNVLEQNNDI